MGPTIIAIYNILLIFACQAILRHYCLSVFRENGVRRYEVSFKLILKSKQFSLKQASPSGKARTNRAQGAAQMHGYLLIRQSP